MTFAELVNQITPQVIYNNLNIYEEDKEKLYDWFQFRELCTDDTDKFLVFYRRYLQMYYPKYLLLLETEIKDTPEFNNYKIEITTQNSNYGTITDTVVGSIINSIKQNTKVDDTGTVGDTTNYTRTISDRYENHLKDTSDSNTTNTSSISTNNNDTSTNNITSDSDNKGLTRQLPQSISYGDGTSESPAIGSDGYPEKFAWDTATAQGEDKSHEEQHVTNTSLGETLTNNEEASSVSSVMEKTGYTTDAQTIKDDKTNTLTRNLSSVNTGETSGTQSNNTSSTKELDDKHDTLRTIQGVMGISETQLREDVWNFIQNSISFDWLRSKMEVCFMGVYE